MKLLVLGAGQQGRTVAANLAARDDVTEVVLADVAPPPSADVPARVRPVRVDATSPDAVRDAARGADAAVTLLPGAIGTVALPALVDAGVPTVDVSFTPDLPFHLHERAQKAGVQVVVDVGVAPGLSHVLAAALHRELDGLDELRILVGGIPLDPRAPWRHAVYFNARDLLDEYLRPARLRRGGRDLAPDPLDASEALALRDGDVGALEAFPSDGLRSLLPSFPDVPEMVELTLRVPGHLALMRDLAGLGLFEADAVDDTARVLARRFPGDAHPDRLLMEVHGRHGGRAGAYRLHVQREGTASAMSRATAFTAAAVTVLLARGAFTEAGVHAPERLGADASLTDALLADLAAHGIAVTRESRLTA